MITVLLLNINVTANATTITGFIQKSDYGFGVFFKEQNYLFFQTLQGILFIFM